MNKVTEEQLQAHQKTTEGKRVTMDDLMGNIYSEHYFTSMDGVIGETFMRGERAEEGSQPDALSYLTFCVMVLKNGFTVTGQSACADPAMFNREIGKKIAKEDALKQIWPLMGYALKQEIYLANGR
jgi:hypothetical protein